MTVPAPAQQHKESHGIGLRLRHDVKWQLSDAQGTLSRSWLATDPLTRKIFRCGEHEYQLLQWLDGSQSLQEIADRFNREFAPLSIDAQDIQSLIRRCAQSGILRKTSSLAVVPQATAGLLGFEPLGQRFDRGNALAVPQISQGRSASRLLVIMRELASVALKITQTQLSLGNPDGILSQTAPLFGWLYSRTAVACWLVFSAIACGLVSSRFDQLWSELPNFQSLRSPAMIVGYGLIFVVTRFFHELGHAIVCKRSGVACRDVGLMISFGMACPYVDISEAWRVNNRYVRMAIAMAGIYTELIIASFASLIWFATHPGSIHDAALQTMLVCSVTTILFNANPLMKYDGYFVLCDWLKTQHLREKSFAALDLWLDQAQPRSSLVVTLMLSLYFIASTINRLIVSLGILAMIYMVASQWQLAGLGLGAILLYVSCSLLVASAAWTAHTADDKLVKSPQRTTRRSLWLGWLAVGLLLAWGLNMPLPHRVHSQGTFQLGTRQAIYSTVPGRVESALEISGSTPVKSESVIIQLSNEPLERSLLDLESLLIRVNQQIKTYNRTAYFEDRLVDSIPVLESQRVLLEKQLQEKQNDKARLSIMAPGDGNFEPVVALPAEVPESPSDVLFQTNASGKQIETMTWTERRAIGRHLERGTLVGWLVKDQRATVECRLTEEQIVGVQVGTRVRVKLGQSPNRLWEGHVFEVSNISQADSNRPQTAPKPGELNQTAYQLRIELDPSDDWGNYTQGTAEIVFLCPSVSIMNVATDLWLRNVRMR